MVAIQPAYRRKSQAQEKYKNGAQHSYQFIMSFTVSNENQAAYQSLDDSNSWVATSIQKDQSGCLCSL
jgi:hypothetical protein